MDGQYQESIGVNRPAIVAENPAFWLISRIFARTSCISGIISKYQKSLKIETFCSKKLCENVNDSVTWLLNSHF